MAFSDTTGLNGTSNPQRFLGPIGRGAASVGRAIMSAFIAIAEASQMQERANYVMKLRSLSDEELRKRGIDRDDIVAHVFRDKYYV